jgi:hypothetical protein
LFHPSAPFGGGFSGDEGAAPELHDAGAAAFAEEEVEEAPSDVVGGTEAGDCVERRIGGVQHEELLKAGIWPAGLALRWRWIIL